MMSLERISPSAIAGAVNSGESSARAEIENTLARLAEYDEIQPQIWISRPSAEALMAAAQAVDKRVAAGEHLPLAGVPYAVKDNIDVAGLETTAACPAFAYQPETSADVITRLEAAGAICIGKTNLDQFATGLVGTRSPYGIPCNAYNRAFVSGGSSSGSAIAVAAGIVAFALAPIRLDQAESRPRSITLSALNRAKAAGAQAGWFQLAGPSTASPFLQASQMTRRSLIK